jgi:hypothetical protein
MQGRRRLNYLKTTTSCRVLTSHEARRSPRAHHFRRLSSLIVSITISRSASMHFNLPFSASSARSRFTSAGSSWPKRLRQAYKGLVAHLCFLDTSATDVRSASRSMATICSSVNRLFFMGSSGQSRSHSLNL